MKLGSSNCFVLFGVMVFAGALALAIGCSEDEDDKSDLEELCDAACERFHGDCKGEILSWLESDGGGQAEFEEFFGATKSECVDNCEDDADNPGENCAACFDESDCSDMLTCMFSECDEEENNEPCSEISGEYSVVGVMCNEVEHSFGDTMIMIDFIIENDCSAQQEWSEGACSIWTQFELSVSSGSVVIDPGEVTCSEQCTEEQCQAQDDKGEPIAGTLDLDDLPGSVSYTVTQQIKDDNMSPCEVGEVHVSILN